ncbi:MAG: DUF433 domain-containing protein [Microcoleaceae cyanobacterium]
MSYHDIITIEPDKRGGKPYVRQMRITVYDILGWLVAGMSISEIIDDFPELTEVAWPRCGNTPTNQVESLIRAGQEATQELLGNPAFHCLELH